MARIIYGVSGQGFGHAARSYETLTHLEKQGHKVIVLSYNQGAKFLKKYFKVINIPGFGLNYKNNKVVYWRTVYDNAKTLITESKNWPKILKKVKAFKPDLVITDFEPLSANLAHLERLPLISLDNQHQLTNTKISVPKKYLRDFITDSLVVKSMVWGANYYLITSFFKTKITKPKTFIFPAIVRGPIARLKPSTKDFIFVYQNSSFDSLVNELRKIKKEKFVIYRNVTGNITIDNVTIKDFTHDNLDDMKNCKAIIGTAGLSLISEALWLKKPYFAIPVAHQVEQTLNAINIKKMGYGDWAEDLTAKNCADFIKNIPKYRKNLNKTKAADSSELYKKLDSIISSLV
ncbi:MAG: glycosyltransferase [Candidatus Falkowbacteria bacterium]|nr:glycosyltransferase [Candidatus Falkowbacteria bacterium]